MNFSVPYCLLAVLAWMAWMAVSVSGSFTNVYLTSAYSEVVEIDDHASFAVDSENLEENTLTKSVRNNKKRQAIIVMLSARFFDDLAYGYFQKVANLKANFEMITGMQLQYVMTQVGGRDDLQNHADAFRRQGVHFINTFTRIDSVYGLPSGSMTGIYLINFDNFDRDRRRTLKKKIDKKETSMRKYAKDNVGKLFGVPQVAAVAAPAIENLSLSSRSSASLSSDRSSLNNINNNNSSRYMTLSSNIVPPTAFVPPANLPHRPGSSTLVTGGSAHSTYGTTNVNSTTSRSNNPTPFRLDSYGSDTANAQMNSFRSTVSPFSTMATSNASLMFQSQIITKVRPNGAFTLIFKGIQHFDMVKAMGFAADAAFHVTLEEITSNIAIVRRAVAENVNLVWDMAPNFERAAGFTDQKVRTCVQAMNTQVNVADRPKFFTLDRPLNIDTRRFLEIQTLTEIVITSRFDADNVDAARFADFVVVDLTAAGVTAFTTLERLGLKLAEGDLDPANFGTSVNRNTPEVSSRALSEAAKLTGFRTRFNDRYGDRIELTVSRLNVFSETFYNFARISDHQLRSCSTFIIEFSGEDGYDGGGLTRDWFSLLAKEMFNPNYALFVSSETNQNVFFPNKHSQVNPEHLEYFAFVGRIIARSVIENIQLDCHFSRFIYKLILGKSPSLLDLREIDGETYRSLAWLLENDVTGVMDDQTFSVGIEEFGTNRSVDLRPNGSEEQLSEANKLEYVRLRLKYALETSIQPQLNAFLDGFRRVIPADATAAFRVKELEKLISGSPIIDVDDWRANTTVSAFEPTSPQIRWFWQAVESFTQSERRALLMYVTGSPSVPLEGFSHLRSRGVISLFKITKLLGRTNLLPEAHTCFNRIDIPEYPTYAMMVEKLKIVIQQAATGYGMS